MSVALSAWPPLAQNPLAETGGITTRSQKRKREQFDADNLVARMAIASAALDSSQTAQLPDEIWSHIFSYLTPNDANQFAFLWRHARIVNRCFNRVLGGMLVDMVRQKRFPLRVFGIKDNYQEFAFAITCSLPPICDYGTVTRTFINKLVQGLPELSDLKLRIDASAWYADRIPSLLELRKLSRLQQLKVTSGNDCRWSRSLTHEIQGLLENIDNPLLVSLKVAHNSRQHIEETNKVLRLGERLPHLQTLKLPSLDHMSNRFYDALASSPCAKNLRNLAISKGGATIEGIKRLLMSLENLQKLTLSEFFNEDLRALCEGATVHRVTCLSVRFCWEQEGDIGINSLISKIPALQEISFTTDPFCWDITDRVLNRLMQHPNAHNIAVKAVPSEDLISAATLTVLTANNLFDRFNRERKYALTLNLEDDIPRQIILEFLNSFTNTATKLDLSIGERFRSTGSIAWLKERFALE